MSMPQPSTTTRKRLARVSRHLVFPGRTSLSVTLIKFCLTASHPLKLGDVLLTYFLALQLTGKLWNTHHKAEDVEKAVDQSLADLQTDYLDLYLVSSSLHPLDPT